MQLEALQIAWQWTQPFCGKNLICDDVAVYVVAAMSDASKSMLRVFDGASGSVAQTIETGGPVCGMAFDEANSALVVSFAEHRQVTTYKLSDGTLVLSNSIDLPRLLPLGSLQMVSSWSVGSILAGIVQGGTELLMLNPGTLAEVAKWQPAEEGCSIVCVCPIPGRSEPAVALDNNNIKILSLESVVLPACAEEEPASLQLHQDSLRALISQLEFGPLPFRAHSMSPSLTCAAHSSTSPIVAHLSTEQFADPLEIRLQMQQWSRFTSVDTTLTISVGNSPTAKEMLKSLPPCMLQLHSDQITDPEEASVEAHFLLNDSTDTASCVFKFETPVLAYLTLHMLDATITLPKELVQVCAPEFALNLELLVYGACGSLSEYRRAAELHSLLLRDENFGVKLIGVIEDSTSSFALRMSAMDLVTLLSCWMHSLSSVIDIQKSLQAAI